MPATSRKTNSHHLDLRAEQLIAVNNHIPDDQLLSSKQLAALLSVSEPWVEIARHNGEGPEWIALGPRCIRYLMGDVRESWLATRAQMRMQHLAERRQPIRAQMTKKPKAVAKRERA